MVYFVKEFDRFHPVTRPCRGWFWTLEPKTEPVGPFPSMQAAIDCRAGLIRGACGSIKTH